MRQFVEVGGYTRPTSSHALFAVTIVVVVSLFQEFNHLGLPLHALINNAGVMMNDREITKVTT